MQSGGFGGAHGGMPGSPAGPGAQAHAGSHPGTGGHAGCSAGSHQAAAGPAGYAHPGQYQSGYMPHPPLHEAYQYGHYAQTPVAPYEDPNAQGYSFLGLHLNDGNFWKGALVGAALTLLITNETVQRAIMKGVATAYSAAQDGVGELKEMFEDAQAELKKPTE
jgi:hypothetical protein